MSNVYEGEVTNDTRDGESSIKSLTALDVDSDDANKNAAKIKSAVKSNLEALESKLEYNILRDKLKILVLRVLKEKNVKNEK